MKYLAAFLARYPGEKSTGQVTDRTDRSANAASPAGRMKSFGRGTDRTDRRSDAGELDAEPSTWACADCGHEDISVLVLTDYGVRYCRTCLRG